MWDLIKVDWEGIRWKYRHRQWAQPWGEAGGVTESSCSWNLSPGAGAVRPGSVRIRAAADGALPTACSDQSGQFLQGSHH